MKWSHFLLLINMGMIGGCERSLAIMLPLTCVLNASYNSSMTQLSILNLFFFDKLSSCHYVLIAQVETCRTYVAALVVYKAAMVILLVSVCFAVFKRISCYPVLWVHCVHHSNTLLCSNRVISDKDNSNNEHGRQCVQYMASYLKLIVLLLGILVYNCVVESAHDGTMQCLELQGIPDGH